MDRRRSLRAVLPGMLACLVVLVWFLRPVPPTAPSPQTSPPSSAADLEQKKLLSELDRATEASDSEGKIGILRRLGRLDLEQGRAADALERFQQALDLAGAPEPSKRRIELLSGRGAAARRVGEPELARASFEEALGMARRLGDRREEIVALNNLAVLARDALDMDRALDLYNQALAGWRSLEDLKGEAATLLNLGSAYTLVGLDGEAVETLEQALALRRRLGDASRTADVLVALGRARFWSGEIEVAREHYLEALELQRSAGDTRGQAATLDHLGTVDRALGRADVARRRYTEALDFFERVGDRRSQAHTANNLAETLKELGLPAAAAAEHRRALELFRRVDDRAGEAHALYGLARAERALGRLDPARVHVEEALAITEAARDTASGAHLRSSYLAAVHDYHTFHLDVLMELHSREPRAGHDRGILVWGERARARRLLDLLGYAPEPMKLETVQALLDEDAFGEDTSLLLYTFGSERGLLLHVTRHRLSSHPLPPRSELEAGARRLHRLLALSRRRGARVQAELAAAVMGRQLLGPVAADLGSRRLLVVADGALLFVPFAVLPVPGYPRRGEPLVARREVVHLPSVSTRAALRQAPPAAPTGIAVVADPVYSAGDSRLPAPTAAGPQELPRLPYTGVEARRILALAAPRPALDLRGFAANRDAVLADALADWRYVHFATHAMIDSENPERSGLVLSRFHADGRPRESLLRLPDIHRLKLSARLVVLSGCRTGLGRELRGEGLLGLGHGFLDAGARALLVSLWAADDRATAELMGRFYDGLLRRGLSPAAALRRAQESMWRDPHWSAPAYWAGFVLQGDESVEGGEESLISR